MGSKWILGRLAGGGGVDSVGSGVCGGLYEYGDKSSDVGAMGLVSW
jgi:hypothetical protein